MKRTYSIYEAKARFSRIIRLVREQGAAVTISYHGVPVAEIRPVESAAGAGVEARLAELTDAGVLSAPDGKPPAFTSVAKRRGALRRFLAERE